MLEIGIIGNGVWRCPCGKECGRSRVIELTHNIRDGFRYFNSSLNYIEKLAEGCWMEFIHVAETVSSDEFVPTRDTEVFTIGYEGRSFRQFAQGLLEAGVRQVVDVRERAFSWKSGFSKTPLREGLESVGIHYEHMPELGSPKAARDTLKKGGSFKEFLDVYAKHLSGHVDELLLLEELVVDEPTAIMCFERDHCVCHRGIIADRLRQDGFRVLHL